MSWQGISKLEYRRLFGLLVELTHPEDYKKFKEFILNESYNLYNIDPILFQELLWVNDPASLNNIKLRTTKSIRYHAGYREGKTCVSLWYNVKNIAIFKLFSLMAERHYQLFYLLKQNIK